jgi:hypothetical protein
MTNRIGGFRPVAPPSITTSAEPARAVASTSSAINVDSFAGGADVDNPSQADVNAAFAKMSPQDRRDLLTEAKKEGWQPKNELEKKLATKCQLHKGIMDTFQQMTEEAANELEKVLNRMNG